MKNSILLPIFICIFFIIGMSACERTEIQKSSIGQSIELRSEFCANCADNDCCCSIELQNTSSGTASLRLCGTADGLGSCSATPPGSCSAISGGGKLASLNSGNPKQGFCMVKGNAFYIQNTGSGSAAIKITCQYDLTTPQTITVSIPSGNTYYYGTNGSCEVAECQ